MTYHLNNVQWTWPCDFGWNKLPRGNKTLIRSMTMLCGTNNICKIFPDILHIQSKCEKYFVEYWKSHITHLWIWIMLWVSITLAHLVYKHSQVQYPPPQIYGSLLWQNGSLSDLRSMMKMLWHTRSYDPSNLHSSSIELEIVPEIEGIQLAENEILNPEVPWKPKTKFKCCVLWRKDCKAHSTEMTHVNVKEI